MGEEGTLKTPEEQVKQDMETKAREDEYYEEHKDDDIAQEKEFDLGKLLDNPIAKAVIESSKDLFKKEKPDPNMCKISIEAPSDVVLKLFKVSTF